MLPISLHFEYLQCSKVIYIRIVIVLACWTELDQRDIDEGGGSITTCAKI